MLSQTLSVRQVLRQRHLSSSPSVSPWHAQKFKFHERASFSTPDLSLCNLIHAQKVWVRTSSPGSSRDLGSTIVLGAKVERAHDITITLQLKTTWKISAQNSRISYPFRNTVSYFNSSYLFSCMNALRTVLFANDSPHCEQNFGTNRTGRKSLWKWGFLSTFAS